MGKPKALLRKASLAGGTLLVLFLVTEMTTRALEPGRFSLLDSNPYVTLPDNPKIHRHKADFDGRWDGTWYSTNSLGLRGPEITVDGEQLTIVALGDSCTFGKGVRELDSWPRQLETMLLNRKGLEAQPVVANLGVNGYSGATYERIFQDLGAQLEPDIVVLGYNLNDFPNAIRATDQYVFQERTARKILSQELRDTLGRLASYRWVRQMYYHMQREKDWANAEAFARGATADAGDSEVWEGQRRYLSSIRDQASEMGAKLAVFLFPYESQVYLDSYNSGPIDRLRTVCEELGLPFVDLAEEFRQAARSTDPWRDLFLRGDRYHPNQQGYNIVARKVMDLLEREGWL